MPVQPERGLRRLFGDGFLLHSDGGHDLRVRADIVRGGIPPRQDDRDRGAQGGCPLPERPGVE